MGDYALTLVDSLDSWAVSFFSPTTIVSQILLFSTTR